VDEVSFEVGENEILAIIGQSGAGKTTLFKLLAMQEQRTAGSIKMFGQEFSEVRDPQKMLREGQIGLVFQEDVLWHDLTVDQNLELMAKVRGLKPKDPVVQNRLGFLKKLMRLEEYAKMKVRHLSGGSKRKLCCIMALVTTPRLLLMDEASNGVDPMARKNLYTYLRTL
jgi:ABC-2 type transport system ATP-binding protein